MNKTKIKKTQNKLNPK